MTSEVLRKLVEEFPFIELNLVDESVYRSFRVLEPALVSIYDKTKPGELDKHEVITFSYRDRAIGMVSLITAFNEHRPSSRKFYGRIDLVIVKPDFRKAGIANANVLATLLYLLRSHLNDLYSISCLAAHPAMEAILKKYGFVEKRKEDLFVLYEKTLDDENVAEFVQALEKLAKEACQLANYRLRQQVNT